MKLEPGMAYNTKTLNKIFAVLAVIFLIVVVWVVLDDYMRPWKAFQVKALDIKREVLSKELTELEKNLDKKKVEELREVHAKATEAVEQKTNVLEELQKKLNTVEGKIYAQKLINGEFNANVTATQFQYEMAEEKKSRNAPALKRKLDKYLVGFAESKEKLKALESEKKQIQVSIEEAKKEQTTAEKELTAVIGALERKKQAIQTTEINPIWLARNMPFIDYLDPTIKIQQVVLPNLADDRYFQKIPKVDRCTTCHVFIDQPGYESQENPFRTHPKLDLMVGLNSPHPVKNFGCTTCHGGEGHRVNDFNSIAHTPETEEEKLAWMEKYNWHEPHKVPQPMLKLAHTEAACLKCHQETVRVPGGTVVNKGLETIEKYGCYACHKIEGFEYMKKPGPSLEKIAAKVDKEFFKNWVWDPTDFNKKTRMPSFFNQTNNSHPEFVKKNIAEVNAMAEFVYEKSKPYRPFMNYTGGNAENGKQVIAEVGCLACHSVEGLEEESNKVNPSRGPHLTGIGSKVSGDWLVSWLKKPSHYQADTIMPSFRLSDQQVNDVAAYLLSLKNEDFKKMRLEPMNKDLRDEILLEYFTAFDTMEVAKAKLAKMSDREKTLELGHRSVGKYGCYSCHDIEGFDGRAPIGPELSNVGSKPVEQFGFGHEHIEHKRDVWLAHHLEDPRRWDKGVVKPFKDLLKMPKINFQNVEEKDSVVVTLQGLVSEYVPLEGLKRLSANEQKAEEGAKVINKYNCMGCHQIDGVGGTILSMYDDVNVAPPRLVGEGHRVHADWLYHFLGDVKIIRPWLKVRMPTFNLSNEEKNKIVDYFRLKEDQVVFVNKEGEIDWAPGEREAAKELFTKLDCASCHTIGFRSDEPTAPDLHKAHTRLRGSWMEKWLLETQQIMPGTMMPSFWENGESPEPKILGGDSQKQIRALRKYIQELGAGKS